MFKALIPTSALHLIAHVSACASYKLGSVSFMQVVKAGEPACSVILLSLFFGRKYSKLVWLTLIPIVGGVAVGSTTELNFSLAAFLCAMTSNIASALRGVTSKDLQEETGLSGINLYGGIAIVSGIMQLPMSLIAEGSQMGAAFANAPALMAEKGITLFGLNAGFIAYLITGSMFYHLYNQPSYQALGELSPLSHSVANTVKRVVIILASVAVFETPSPRSAVSPRRWLSSERSCTPSPRRSRSRLRRRLLPPPPPLGAKRREARRREGSGDEASSRSCKLETLRDIP